MAGRLAVWSANNHFANDGKTGVCLDEDRLDHFNAVQFGFAQITAGHVRTTEVRQHKLGFGKIGLG